MNDHVNKLPLFVTTSDGSKPTEEQLKKLAEKLRTAPMEHEEMLLLADRLLAKTEQIDLLSKEDYPDAEDHPVMTTLEVSPMVNGGWVTFMKGDGECFELRAFLGKDGLEWNVVHHVNGINRCGYYHMEGKGAAGAFVDIFHNPKPISSGDTKPELVKFEEGEGECS